MTSSSLLLPGCHVTIASPGPSQLETEMLTGGSGRSVNNGDDESEITRKFNDNHEINTQECESLQMNSSRDL